MQPGANGRCVSSETAPDNIGQPSKEMQYSIDNGDSSENDLTETPHPSEGSGIRFKSSPDEGAESYPVITLPPSNNIGGDIFEIVGNEPILSTEEERNTTIRPPTNVRAQML
nr:hypothetical transcript [Hymenolepis microstoma]